MNSESILRIRGTLEDWQENKREINIKVPRNLNKHKNTQLKDFTILKARALFFILFDYLGKAKSIFSFSRISAIFSYVFPF